MLQAMLYSMLYNTHLVTVYAVYDVYVIYDVTTSNLKFSYSCLELLQRMNFFSIQDQRRMLLQQQPSVVFPVHIAMYWSIEFAFTPKILINTYRVRLAHVLVLIVFECCIECICSYQGVLHVLCMYYHLFACIIKYWYVIYWSVSFVLLVKVGIAYIHLD